MKTKHLSLVIAGLMLCAVACKKSALQSISHNKSAITDSLADVYIAGYVMTKGNTMAAYWKNGVITKLGDSVSQARATGIAVLGNDVYVVGVSGLATQSAVYWKNGVATTLSPNAYGAQANCIAIHGNDIYIGGAIYSVTSQTGNVTTTGTQPTYWKNGVAATIPGASAINSIVVNGNNVYIAGVAITPANSNSTNSTAIAAYWENGGPAVTLSYPQSYQAYYGSQVNAIAVSGADVYAAGITGEYPPEYWKNGVATPLTNGTVLNSAYGIATNGTDVYVVGDIPANGTDYAAAYWKNNIPVVLSTTPSGNPGSSLFSTAYAVALNGKDVYIAGQAWDNGSSYYAAYFWKNGVPTILSNGGSKGAFATSIAVVPK